MKPIILTFFTLMLTACSSKISTSYYQLNTQVWQTQASSLPIDYQHQLMIEPVVVADFLAGNGIVMQTSPVRYQIANQHLWGSPLDQQLQQSLVLNLSHQLPNWLVSTQNVSDQQATLSILVTDFQGGNDGAVIIKGTWTYQHDDKILQQPFYRKLKQNAAGYEALVETLSQGWADLANQIAAEINKPAS